MSNFIPDHVAPERRYLEARWASLVPYAAAAGLLADVLPIASGTNATTVRQHTLRVAECAEAELDEERVSFIDGCPVQWQDLPIPEDRILVGLDGCYVRTGKTGRAISRSLSGNPCPRIAIPVISDWCMAMEAEHVLDWFHITMRLTALSQYARGVRQHDETPDAHLLTSLERIKWLLCHGNQYRVRQEIGFFEDDVEGLEVDYPYLDKFTRATGEFATHIADNIASLINYGERFRAGERILSCLAESTVNAS